MASIQITVNHEAFKKSPGEETARILREVADRIERGERRFTVNDRLGNRSAKVKAEDIPRKPG